MDAVDEDEGACVMARLEQLLREHHARPDRCCGSGCLHCPEGRRLVWDRYMSEKDSFNRS